MRTGTDRVLTTHTGSLPRPDDGDVGSVVARQLAAGIDVVGDGEVGKPSYATYVTERLSGFGEPSRDRRSEFVMPDNLDFPEWAADRRSPGGGLGPAPCVGPVTYVGHDALRTQLDLFRAALAEHRRGVAQRLAVLDHATRDVPADRLRMHVCWGNYDGPHTHDLPLADLVGLLLAARPTGISFEAANPRHEHEWTVFDEVTVTDDTVLIPGVVDSTCNYVEHPELVAQRVRRFTGRVGTDRVPAGSDCGFATFGARPSVHPEVTWAKLAALAEGAARV